MASLASELQALVAKLSSLLGGSSSNAVTSDAANVDTSDETGDVEDASDIADSADADNASSVTPDDGNANTTQSSST